MQKHIAAIIATAVVLLTSNIVIAQHSHSEHQTEQEQEQEKMQNYTCPMHPEVITDHSGNCPKCGMKLVPLKESKRSTLNSQLSTSNHQSHTPHHSDQTHQHHGEMEMSMHSTIDLADPMSREGSGTSWIPDSSPMYGRMFMFGENIRVAASIFFIVLTSESERSSMDAILVSMPAS
jgi:hypothetical protein